MIKSAGLFLGIVTAALLGACGAVGITGPGGGGGGSAASATGLPCDVADVINAKCASCHSSPPTAGAPTPLLSAADLQAPAKTDPSVTMAVMSVKRMGATAAAMPPGGGSTPAEIAAFQKWIDAGYPQGDCGGMSNPDPAFTGMSTCTSNKYWQKNNTDGKELMQPGLPCNDCHKKSGSAIDPLPIFAAAGTVYPTGHEPDLCYGIDNAPPSNVVVHITGADGVDHIAAVNATGNFVYDGPLKLPYTAKVVSPKGERVMSEPQKDGDCNLCHTDAAGGNGTAAAGRVVIPY